MTRTYPSFRVVDRLRYGYLRQLVSTDRRGRRCLDFADLLGRLAGTHPLSPITEPFTQIVALLDPCPESELERFEREECGDVVRTWRGIIRPFPSTLSREEIEKIVADLHDNLTVLVGTDGALRHLPECRAPHRLPLELMQLGPLGHSYEIEIAYRVPPAHPVVRSLEPEITQFAFPDDRLHLLGPQKALCVLFPPEDEWDWNEHGAREYADYTAIWLAKFSIWVDTSNRFGLDKAVWIGLAVPHGSSPSERASLMLKRIADEQPCHCGSAKEYISCHKGNDLRESHQSGRAGSSSGR